MYLKYSQLAHQLINCISTAGDEIALVKRTALKRKYKEEYELVTDADLLSHNILSSSLNNIFPGVHLIMEEQHNKTHIPQVCIVVDELDGTIVYSLGGNDWGITAAYLEGGQPVAAAIYLPDRSISVYTSIGGGTWMNSQKIMFGPTVSLTKSVLLTEINAKLNKDDQNIIFTLVGNVLGVRALACATASIVDMLLGRGHIYLNCRGGKIWDFAAGVLAVREAGGKVTQPDGEPIEWNHIEMGVLMANSEVLLNEIMSIQNEME